MQQAIGVIETAGMPGALVTADVMGKAANVQVVGLENTDAGRISVIIRGSTGAVQAAIAAAMQVLQAHPGITLLGSHIVPCPDTSVDMMGWLQADQTLPPQGSVEWLDD
ncbi:MAG: BMC domain-containing protein [Cyanobacteria bacterium P01_F01_bin.56]